MCGVLKFLLKAFLVCFLIFSAVLDTQAQILNAEAELFGEVPFFNAYEIKKLKIKSITGEMHIKKDFEKMSKKALYIQYNFDEQGRLLNQISTFKKPDGKIDTTVILYEYDALDRVLVKRKADAFGYYSYNYEYDQNNNVVKETYCRDINKNLSLIDFKLEKQYPVAIESFSYQYVSATQYKVKFLNNLAMPYKEAWVNTDEKGKLLEKSTRFINTGKKEKLTLKYNAQGNVIQKTEFSDVGGEQELVQWFKYDEKNRLIEQEKFKNNHHVGHSEYLYDGNSLLNAHLSRDLDTKVMDVVKYSYKFY